MGIPKLMDNKFSYSDYLSWNKDERWEIIYGVAYNMCPAPKRKHQEISGKIFSKFFNYLEGKKCRVYAAPFDVRFAEKDADNENIFNVVQPDISIFCDRSKLDDKGALGAPDLIVEILSEYTSHKDLNIKLLLYQEYGVKEYWIINPEDETLNVYFLNQHGRYKLVRIYSREDKVNVILFPDLEIELKNIFEE
ncbi:MAG: Uma2 family endonuclease [Bacteroidia bacterium]|nr:Uma2 family endonuclease [Bacteroidia bacterium]